MKKILSLLLVLALACSMNATVYAEEATIKTTVPERHTVTIEAEGGSVIANNRVCGGTVRIERLKEQTYWIVPDEGKELDKLYYNGEDVTGQMKGYAFTAPALTGDAALRAVFKDAEVTAEESYTVGGAVTDEEGNPIPGATVDIGGHTGVTDEDGHFTIPDVPPGTYPVVITDENGSIIGVGEITIGQPEEDDPIVTEDENGNPVITPGTDSTNIDLTIVVDGEGGIGLEAADAYTRDEYLDEEGTGTAPAENGSAAVTLEDGTKITVTGITEEGLWLVVRPITDPELVVWFEKCVAPYGTHIYPMDIYFVDSRGVRTEISGTITVVIVPLEEYAEPIVCYVAPDGAVAVMDSSVKGKEITFRTNHNSYYVLAEKRTDGNGVDTETPGKAEPEDPSKPDEGTSGGQETGNSGGADTETGTSGSSATQGVLTGDSGRVLLWGMLILLACSGLTGILLADRKKKRNAD